MSERCKKHALVSFDGCEICQLDEMSGRYGAQSVDVFRLKARIAELEGALRKLIVHAAASSPENKEAFDRARKKLGADAVSKALEGER